MKSETMTARDFGVAETLKALGLEDLNNGACTGVEWFATKGESIESLSPADGMLLGKIRQATAEDYERIIQTAEQAFLKWRMVPAPKRGEVVRQIGDRLREY